MMLMIIACFSAFAEKPAGWSWSLTDLNKLKEIQSKLTPENDFNYAEYIKFQIALAENGNKDMTYNEFKALAKKTSDFDILAPQFVINCKRFNKFAADMMNDEEFSKLNYVKLYIPYDLYSPAQFREYFFVKKKISLFGDVERYITLIINKYYKYSINYTREEIKSDMEFAKRIVYPKIGDSEDYKNLMVKIELLKKSVE